MPRNPFTAREPRKPEHEAFVNARFDALEIEWNESEKMPDGEAKAKVQAALREAGRAIEECEWEAADEKLDEAQDEEDVAE